jgi:hypothetical protein
MKTKVLYIVGLLLFLHVHLHASVTEPIVADSVQWKVWVNEGVQQLNNLIKQNAKNEALRKEEENNYLFSFDPSDRYIFEEAREQGAPARDFGYDATSDAFLDLNASLKGFNTNATLNPKGIKLYVCLTSRFEAYYTIPVPEVHNVQERIDRLEEMKVAAIGDDITSGGDRYAKLEQNIQEQKAIHTKFTQLFKDILAKSELQGAEETIVLSVALAGYFEKKEDKLLRIKAYVGGYQFQGDYVNEIKEEFKQQAPLAFKSGDRFQAIQTSLNKAFSYLRDKAVLPDEEGPGDAFYSQYYASASEAEKAEIEEIRGLYNRMGEVLLDGYTQQAWAAQKPYYQVYYDGYGEWGYTFEQYKEALTTYVTKFEEISEKLKTVSSQNRAVLLLTKLDDKQLEALPFDVRINALKAISSETMRGLMNITTENSETLAIRLLETTPENNWDELLAQLVSEKVGDEILLARLDAEYSDTEFLLEDGNYTNFIQSVLHIFYTLNNQPDKISLFSQLSDQNQVFRWTDNLDGTFYQSEFGNEGIMDLSYREKVRTVIYEYGVEDIYETVPYTLGPFDWLAIHTEVDIPALGFSKGEVVFGPAVLFHYLIEERLNANNRTKIRLAIDIAAFAIGVGEIQLALRAANGIRLTFAVVETVVTGGDILLTASEDEITYRFGDEGREFVKSWNTISSIVGIATIGQGTVERLTKIMPEKIQQVRLFFNKNGEQLSSIIPKSKYDNIKAVADKLEDNYRQTGYNLDELAAAAKEADELLGIGKKISELLTPPPGYNFYTRANGKKWIRRVNAMDSNTPRLTVRDGVIVRFSRTSSVTRTNFLIVFLVIS